MKNKGTKITAILAATILAGLLLLPYLVDLDRFRPQMESSLKSSLGREVHLGHMDLSILAGGAHVEQFSIGEDPSFGTGTFLQAKSVGVGLSLWSLIFSHALHVNSFALDEPQLTLLKSADGKWNFSTLGTSSASQDESSSLADSLAPSVTTFMLDHLKISNATIQVATDPKNSKPMMLKNINLDLKNVSLASTMNFVLTAHSDEGKLKIDGQAGPVNSENPAQTPFRVTMKADKADLAQIASLGSSSALRGLVSLDGTLTSDGSTVHAQGNASAEKFRLAAGGKTSNEKVSLRYETEYSLFEQAGAVRNSEIMVGKNSAAVSGTYELKGEDVTVHMKISGDELPVDNVMALLPALGIVLPGGSVLRGGTIKANLSLDGPIDRMVTSGSAKITDAHVSATDLCSKLAKLPGMSALKGSTDIPVSDLAAHFRVAPSSTKISDFNGQFEGIGKITGDGEISGDEHLDFKMVAHVPSDGAVRFGLNHIGLKNVPNDLPFQVLGTTSVPLIIPDLSGMTKNTSKAVASNAAKSSFKKALESVTKKESSKKNETAPSTQAANNKKSGFFGKLFHRKNKDKSDNSAQLAAQKSKF